MTQYVATINVPGYLPMDDDPPVFDTPREAWAWLADERVQAEDDAPYDTATEPGYSATVNKLESLGNGTLGFEEVGDGDGTGSVTGDTPGYKGDHDLGLAYSVSVAEEEEGEVVITHYPGQILLDPDTGEITGTAEEEPEEERTYSIIRFAQDVGRRVVKTGLTLDEAREHCNDPATRGEGWFDGYEEE